VGRLSAVLIGLLAASPGAADVDHGLYTEILKAYVRGGHVKYAALCSDERLPEYLERLESVEPKDLSSDAERLAFWMNAYNAFTLKVICDDYPIDSINDLHFGGRIVGSLLNKTVWDRAFIRIAGDELSLNDIEHKIIRERFDDARIHFALVCAAVSCPPLRTEAYVAERLDEQLNNQGRSFMQDPAKNRFDLTNKVAHLSRILDWYSEDFGSNRAEVLLALTPFLPKEIAEAITDDPESWRVSYLDYDWGLND
jgi:hypothetical protein